MKMNRERNRRFQLMTSIVRENEHKVVKKTPLSAEAEEFLSLIAENGRLDLGEYRYLPASYQKGCMKYPFLTGVTYHRIIKDYIDQGYLEGVFKLLDDLFEKIFSEKKLHPGYQNPEFMQVFGECKGKEDYECVAPANIDLICENIFVEKAQKWIIDYEWVFPFAVPVPFIIWRTIHELYSRISGLSQLCSRRDMLQRYGIERSDDEIFFQWTKHFVYRYVGCDKMDAFRKERIHLPLERLAGEKNVGKNLKVKVYYDLGWGLGEDQVLEQSCQVKRKRFRFHINFQQIQGITGIRWDFVTDCEACIIRIDRIQCGSKVVLRPMEKYIQSQDCWIFLTGEPMFFVDCWNAGEIGELTVEGQYEPLGMKAVRNILRSQIRENEKLTQELKKEQDAYESLSRQLSVREESEIRFSRRAWLKRVVKRMLGKETENSLSREQIQCLGSVDVFQTKGQEFSVVGWAFDPIQPMQSSRISFYDGEEKLLESSFMVIYRKDVAVNLGFQEAEGSGFALNASIRTPKELTVYLEYGTPMGVGRMRLGTIPANCNRSNQSRPEIIVLTDSRSLGDIRFFKKSRLAKTECFPTILSEQKYDVIIPVYNGLYFFDRLFSSLERTRLSYRLILIDDHSPDEKAIEFLKRYAQTHDNVILIRNEENMGFVRSVNKGLAMAENHVALVNTDVEVPEEWLERLMLPIVMDSQIATTTPFTNCGTICSFPNFCEDNELFEGMEVWQIDNAFRQINPQYPAMPTGVGFCMGMNLGAIRKVGLLDAETFGKGYGEENDWCQRAVKAGFRNVLVDNLFVYHKHGGSFLSEEKAKLLEHNLQELARRHPNYNRETADFCRRDPAGSVRLYVTLQLLNQVLEKKTYVAFDHSLGGGATEYLDEKVREILSDGGCIATVRYNIYENKYRMIFQYKKYQVECFSEDLNRILCLLPRIDEIWINELVTFQNIYQIQNQILRLKEQHQAFLKMLLHDFFAICPAVNLMDERGHYCEVAEPERCNMCIPLNKSNACLDYGTGTEWREKWGYFLENCDEIIAFSDDSARLLKKAYPGIHGLHVIPHTPHYLPALEKKKKTTKTLNIGLLGVLCYKKGLEVIQALVQEIEQSGRNVRIRLLGISDEEIDSPVFSQTGRYTREMLPRLTLEQDIDIFLIPSIWPETFSYTTSEIMSMHMPIAVFPIGAPVERVEKYRKGMIIQNESPKQILDDLEHFLYEKCGFGETSVDDRKVLFVGEEVSFASRYRVEHFREQLLLQGIASKFVMVDEAKREQLDSYSAVIFYRCSKKEQIQKLVRKAKESQCAVFYDIDDLIFDYDKIRFLHFLEGEEYRGFEKTTKEIHYCMDLCDGYITSTETLAEQIRAEFPKKPVVVNRNCASMEMQVLSYDALRMKEHSDKLYIGYFSGSGTHDRDFALIEDVLLEVMDRYPNVYLKLVGVLSENRMKRMQNRIEKLGFMEWQKLPSVIAGVDISLMPLEDSLFHCCKSENKWMEAAWVKVPSVMSRNRELEHVVENKKTGFLCSTKEEWTEALESLITRADLRRNMGEAAYEEVCRKYMTQNTGAAALSFVLGEKTFQK